MNIDHNKYEESLLDFYLEANSIKNAVEGLVLLVEQNENRSEGIQMQDLTVLTGVANAVKALAGNHAMALGKASGYEWLVTRNFLVNSNEKNDSNSKGA